MRRICQICFKDDCHCFKPLLQQEYGRHAAYGEHASSYSFQDKNDDVSLQMKVVASTSSSSQEGKKDEHSKQHKRYKSFHDQFDCVSARHDHFTCFNGRKFPCTYCGQFNHHVSRCWMRKKAYREQMKQRLLSKKVHKICTFCQKKGHVVSHCWTLHPTFRPTHMQQDDKKIGKGGTTDSIIDVEREVSHKEQLQQQKSPLKWLGKKWLDFLTQ